MQGIKTPLRASGRGDFQITSSPEEKIGLEVYQFVAMGKPSNPWLIQEGKVMDSPVYTASTKAAWGAVKGRIRDYFKILEGQGRAKLLKLDTVEGDGRTLINLSFAALESGNTEQVELTI